MNSIEYGGAARRGGGDSGLFSGITFWLARQVPSRSRYRDDIVKHGGTVSVLESEADMKIHDHLRVTTPAGTYSYTFIDQSIRDGVLANKDQHRAGQARSVVRQPGDITQPTRRSKVAYTKEDDCLLHDWMTEHLNSGGADGGNKIYQAIAEQHPRHTSQSWRDRWLKQLKGRPRPVPRSDHAIAQSPTAAVPSNESMVPTASTFRVPPRVPARVQESLESSTLAPASRLNQVTDARPELLTDAAQERKTRIIQTPTSNSDLRSDEPNTRSQMLHQSIEATSAGLVADATPSTAQNAVLEDDQRSTPAASQTSQPEEIVLVPQDEVKLWRAAPDLEDINVDDAEVAWDCWAEEEENRHYSGETWRWIWESHVRPRWITGLQRAQLNAQSNHPTPQPDHDIAPRMSAEPATNQAEVADSPSRRATANTSRRLVPNSQSTGSQPTTQESEPVTQRKRKRPEPASKSVSQALPRKKRSTDQAYATLASRQDDGQGPHEEEELASEHDAFLYQENIFRASPSLTDPNSTTSSGQSMNHAHFTTTMEHGTQGALDFGDIEANSASGPDSSRVSAKGSRAAARASVLTTATPAPQMHSSYSSTTTPGNTARPHIVSPTPKRRHQQPASSNFSTTTPGNTAVPPPTQPQSQSDDSQDPYVSDWFARKKALGHFTLGQITEAFEAASYDLDLADMALRGIRRRGKLPEDQPGIWTKEDDRHLRSNDLEAWRRLRRKHGLEGCAKRQDWLTSWKDGID